MKKLFTILFFLLFLKVSFSQIEIKGAMGIDFISAPSLTDYLNQNFAPSFDQLGTFNSAVNFSLEGDYFLSKNYQVGIEISYLINSFTFGSDLGQYDLSYNIISPALINYYVLPGLGYEFKFGGGIAFPFVIADESLPGTGITTTYNSNGVAFLLRAEGNTLLDGNFYINIGGDLKYSINGKPKNNGNYLINTSFNDEKVNFNSFSAEVRLGITYKF